MSQPFLKKDNVRCSCFSSTHLIKGCCRQFYLASVTPNQQIGIEFVPKWYLQLLKLVYVKKKC